MLARVLESALRRPALPFLLFAVAAQASLARTGDGLDNPGWALVAIALFLVTCLLVGLTRRPGWTNLQLLAPLLFLVVLALWRHAIGTTPSGFEVIALLPVAWVALFGTMRQVAVTVVAFGVVLITPIYSIGAPEYPREELRSAVVVTVFAAFIAPTAQYLVRQLDRESARMDAVLRAATGHAIIACDLDGGITEFNTGAERMLGWPASEVLGHSFVDLVLVPQELETRAAELGVQPGLRALVHAVTAAGGMETRDWTYQTRGGALVVVSLTVTGIRNADGQLVGYMAVATDVTEMRRALDSLQSQREVYRLLLDHLPGTTAGVVDENLRCVTIGGHWVTHGGLDVQAMLGRPIAEFFDEADRAAGMAIYEAGREGRSVGRLRLANGKHYEIEVVPLTGPQGQAWMLSVARDITHTVTLASEREEMDVALAVSEASFREAFEGAPIGIALTTVSQGPEERFLRVNRVFAEMLGRDPDSFHDVPVSEYTHPEDANALPDLTADGIGATRLRKRFLHASGRSVWVEVSYAVVRDRDGAPSHVIKHIQDIRTIKESERALLEALEQQRAAMAGLRELDTMRREVVGTVSHELRTPLTSIHGYLELLAEEANLTKAQHQMIEVAMRNSLRLAGLVDNLLVLAKLEADDTTTVPFSTEIVVQDAVRAAIDTVRPELSDRGQRLSTRMAMRELTVVGDAEQLQRALLNLLTNASKYTPQGGTIEVEVAAAGDCVSIGISDTGIGIPKDEQLHLFERFFRASTARDQAIGGNGLGLAIVKSIVDMHDGRITVDSEPGRGSCFCIELPVRSALESQVVSRVS